MFLFIYILMNNYIEEFTFVVSEINVQYKSAKNERSYGI